MALSQIKNEGLGMVKTPQIKFVKVATGAGLRGGGGGGGPGYERHKADVEKNVGVCNVSKQI